MKRVLQIRSTRSCEVLAMFRGGGDTKEIADKIDQRESIVEKLLHYEMEKSRRAVAQQTAQG